jgi:Flp pilus assembly protein TadD
MENLGLTLLLTLLNVSAIHAAPYIPASDEVVLETLPFKANDPVNGELRRLRAELSQDPQNLAKAVTLAQRYYQLALADGDPRYIGYAQAALAPWWELAEPPVAVLVQRAALRQYTHQFDSALADLKLAISRSPNHGTAWSLRAAIHMVLADYATARQDCEQLQGQASKLIVIACIAAVDSLNGKAGQAYNTLLATHTATPLAAPRENLWVLTRLAEMSDRLGRTQDADSYFKQALKLNISDAYLLAVYAEFLHDEQRYDKVIALLGDKQRSDVLLMRLTLAEQASNAPDAAKHIEVIRARFDAAHLRGDKLHIQDEARFNLHLLNNPAAALRLAQENWLGQHEPSDARILLETSLASKDKTAAQPAVDWFEKSRIEDRHLQKLINAVRELK